MENQLLQQILNEVKKTNSRMDKLESHMNKLDERMNKLDTRMDRIENDIKVLKTQAHENTHILKSLEHSSQVHKALLDQLDFRTVNIEGQIKNITNEIHDIEFMTGKNISDIALLKTAL